MNNDILKIVLITFNRAQYLKQTLSSILSPQSPARDIDITILDNHSTDDTKNIIAEFTEQHPNLHHIVNKFNVGGNANIARALERCSTNYHWILCDDDEYDWSHWHEVEQAMSQGEKIICVGDMHLPKEGTSRSDPAQLIQQMTFLPSIIYGPGVINEVALRNAYDNIYAFFPHLAPVIGHINAGGTIYPIAHGIVRPCKCRADCSYTRGYDKQQIFPLSRTMNFPSAFAYITEGITDRKLSKRTFAALVFGSQLGRLGFYGEVFATMRGYGTEPNFQAIMRQSSWGNRMILRILRLLQKTPIYWLAVNPKTYALARRIVDRINDRAQKRLQS